MSSAQHGLPVGPNFRYVLHDMKLNYDSDALHRFCRERGIAKLELFGSALRDDFQPDTGVDLLCTLTAEKDNRCDPFEWVDIKLGLEEIFSVSSTQAPSAILRCRWWPACDRARPETPSVRRSVAPVESRG